MKIHVLNEASNELKIELEGEDHTFCNVLQKILLEDRTIEMVGYDIPHPLVSNPIIYIRTKGSRKPERALRDAAKKLQKKSKDFRITFENALKAWEKD